MYHKAPPQPGPEPQSQPDVIQEHHGAAARVPLEVLETVASNVDDEESLSSCSLVCRLWSAAARRHRFRVVEISFEWPRDGQRFTHIQLLCDPTSAVLPFVREIRFSDKERFLRNGIPSFNDILPAIRVSDLSMLQSLTIVDFTWGKLSDESQRTLKQLYQKITSLSINVWSAPEGISSTELIRILQLAKSLRKLCLINSGISGGRPHHPSETHDLRRSDKQSMSSITSIRITDSCLCAYVPALLSTFSFPRLTEVALEDITRAAMPGVMSFLRVCSSTLEHLRLMFGALLDGFSTEEYRRGETWHDIEGFFISRGGLSNLSALRSLHLTADLPHVPAILQPLMHAMHFEELTIKASPYMLRRCDQAAFTGSISTLARAVGRLRVSFLCEYDSDRRDPLRDSELLFWMRDTLRAKLPELEESKRLRFLRIIRNRDTGRKCAIEEF